MMSIDYLKLLFLWLVFPLSGKCGEWPEFRGPGGQGHTEAVGLPLRWSEQEHVVWKTPLPGRGWSSPVVAGNQLWMTTAIEISPSAAAGPDNDDPMIDALELRALCVDRTSGKLVRNVRIFDIDDPLPLNPFNSHASPTPVLEEGRLYCHFGTYGTACLETDQGRIAWRNQSFQVDHQNGPGSSPVVWQDLLILTFDGSDLQFVAAVNKHTGERVWQTPRSGKLRDDENLKKAYSTPLLLSENGRTQLISAAADWVYAYRPADGRELWRASYGTLGYSTVPRPVAGHGMVFVCTSYDRSRLLAIRHDGEGDVTESHVVWTRDRQIPQKPSLLLVEGRLYYVHDDGIAVCLEAETGDQVWRKRLGGNFSASPLLADGRIYVFSQEGETRVFLPGETYTELARNRLDGRIMASPAVAGRAFFIRTATHIYRIEAEG